MNVVADSKAKVCLGHLELTGFEAVPGVRMEHGMDPEPFEKFDLTCSGHFHMKSRQGNINTLVILTNFIGMTLDTPVVFTSQILTL